MKKSGFMFFPNDWIADTRGLSLSALGLWLEMIIDMQKTDPMGVLEIPEGNEQKLFEHFSHKGIKSEIEKIGKSFQELKVRNIFTIEGNKIICRRLYREHLKIQARKDAAKSRWDGERGSQDFIKFWDATYLELKNQKLIWTRTLAINWTETIKKLRKVYDDETIKYAMRGYLKTTDRWTIEQVYPPGQFLKWIQAKGLKLKAKDNDEINERGKTTENILRNREGHSGRYSRPSGESNAKGVADILKGEIK